MEVKWTARRRCNRYDPESLLKIELGEENHAYHMHLRSVASSAQVRYLCICMMVRLIRGECETVALGSFPALSWVPGLPERAMHEKEHGRRNQVESDRVDWIKAHG